MSAFLGPIHHWLFRKINLFEALEKDIVNTLSKEFDKGRVEEIFKKTQAEYGEFIPGKPLEELIDVSNIHAWLQNKITIAELRQAATIKESINAFGMDSIKIIAQAYENQAKTLAEELAATGKITNAPEIYQELNNNLLEGMPCDNVNNVITSSPEELKWQITQCLHKPYWDRVGMDAATMYNLRFLWIKSFIENIHPDYNHHVERKGEISHHRILLK